LDEVYYDPGDQVYANCEDKTPVKDKTPVN
jgi:hypothetical protein